MTSPLPKQQSIGKIEAVKLILQVISTGSIVVAAVGAVIAYQAFKAQHEWNRRLYTLEMIRNYDRDGKPHLDALITYWPDALLTADKQTVLTKEEARAVYRHPSRQSPSEQASTITVSGATRHLTYEEQIERRRHLIAYLNYLEAVCIAYETHIVDRDTVYQAFESLFRRCFRFFEEVIAVAQEEQKSTTSWEPIKRVVGEWRLRSEKPRSAEQGPTG